MKNKKQIGIITIHVVFWIAYFLLALDVFSRRETDNVAIIKALILILPQILLAYANILLYFPRFYAEKKYWQYTTIVLGSFILLFFIYRHLPEMVIDPDKLIPDQWRRGRSPAGRPGSGNFNLLRMRAIFNLGGAFSIYLISSIYAIAQLAQKKEKEADQLKNEKLNAELKFLKSQINPHFLFNALNNIYALSLIESKETPRVVLELSEIMRYNLYDGNKDYVPLEKELKYIENFISLQKLKDDKLGKIELKIGNIDRKIEIAPLIFVPFIENSFKHSKIEDVENGWIRIALEVGKKELHFFISNSLPDSSFTKDKQGGIGLENVKRRLELIYPGKHSLNITEDENAFTVDLILKI